MQTFNPTSPSFLLYKVSHNRILNCKLDRMPFLQFERREMLLAKPLCTSVQNEISSSIHFIHADCVRASKLSWKNLNFAETSMAVCEKQQRWKTVMLSVRLRLKTDIEHLENLNFVVHAWFKLNVGFSEKATRVWFFYRSLQGPF